MLAEVMYLGKEPPLLRTPALSFITKTVGWRTCTQIPGSHFVADF
eukprot:SAG25_NODE_322_length_9886_cov_11.794217_13_plen_45_part_00